MFNPLGRGSGADGVAVPWPGEESFQSIIAMAAGMPIWLKPSKLPEQDDELEQVLDLGGIGLWLNDQLFAAEDPIRRLETINSQIHPLPQNE